MSNRLEAVAQPAGSLFKVSPRSIPLRDSSQIKRLAAKASSLLRNSLGGGIIERLDDVIKCLVAKLFDEQELAKGKARPDFAAWEEKESPSSRYRRVKALYARAIADERLSPVIDDRKREFCRDQMAVAKIVELFHPYRFGDSFHDVKGSAFQEILRDTLDKNDNQQFFTPTEIAEFMADVAILAVAEPLTQAVICDPAVGSGGLLTAVVRRAIATINGALNRERIRQYVRSKVWGADCDDRMAWIAAINLLLLTDDPGNILHVPGGGSLDRMANARDGRSITDGSIDLIVTNPPFGSEVMDPRLLNQWDLGQSRAARRRSVLFVERCVRLLRPGGVCVIVLDDSVLSQRSTFDVRAWLLHRADLLAVFSLPDTAFMPYATAKASIIVLRRSRNGAPNNQSTLMVEIEQTGRKPNGEPLFRNERDEEGQPILDSDLPRTVSRFGAFLAGKRTVTPWDDRPLSFVVTRTELENTGRIDAGAQQEVQAAAGPRIDVLRYHPLQRAAEIALGQARFPVVCIRDLVDVRSSRVNPVESPDETFRYVGLAEIEKFTGEWKCLELRGDLIKSTCSVFKGGDIIFARMRPNLRKVVLLPDDDPGGVCSSECAVLRARDKGPLDADQRLLFPAKPLDVDSGFLVWLLRSDLVQGQILAQVTGVGRPRIATSAILAVRIPLPPLAEQCDISRKMQAAWRRFAKARKRAIDSLNKAEKELLRQYGTVSRLLCNEQGLGTN